MTAQDHYTLALNVFVDPGLPPISSTSSSAGSTCGHRDATHQGSGRHRPQGHRPVPPVLVELDRP